MPTSKEYTMPEVTKPSITYGKGLPTSTTVGAFYKDLLTDIMYQKVKSGDWEVKPVHPQYKMYMQ